MILVDASIWIDHLRTPETLLNVMLEKRQILTHPFVIGEVALGHVQQRERFLGALHLLPRAAEAYNEEVFAFITSQKLFGTGIGYVDAHLLVAARMTPNTSLWTRDKRLLAVAERLNLAWSEPKPS